MPTKDDSQEPLFSHTLLSSAAPPVEPPSDEKPSTPPGQSTGPRTPEGKQCSSQNARTHGCTSRTLLLPGEKREEYEMLLADWLHDYQPQAATAYELVVQTAQAHWLYLRVQKQSDAAELGWAGAASPDQWSEEEWKRRERLGRYRTTAERTFHRALGAIEARRKSRLAECGRAEAEQQRAQRIEMQFLQKLEQAKWQEEKLRRQAAREQTLQVERDARREERRLEREAKQAREEAKEARRQVEREARQAAQAVAAEQKRQATSNKTAKSTGKKKKNAFGVAEQWVEVRIVDGVTTTLYVPSNEEMLDIIADKMDEGEPEPEMVCRRLYFPNGVPPEYAWTNLHRQETCEKTQAGAWCPLCVVAERGGCGLQRMTFETWQQIIEREQEVPGGHAGPTGVGNLPQPKERGGDVPFAELCAWQEKKGETDEANKQPVSSDDQLS